MKTIRRILLCGMLVVAIIATATFAKAQLQTTGVPGSPDATTTISGKQLPAPYHFAGKINKITVGLKEMKTADKDEADKAQRVAWLKKELSD